MNNPFLITVEDCREFVAAQKYFKQAGVKVNFEEVGLDYDGRYCAVFYTEMNSIVKNAIDEYKSIAELYN